MSLEKEAKKKAGKAYTKYVPKSLSPSDKKKQIKSLAKGTSRPKVKSYTTRKSTWTEKFHKKNGKKSLDWIYKNIIKRKQGEQIIKKGKAAYRTSGSRPNQTAHSWAYARLGSVLLKRNSYKVDKHVLDYYGVTKIKPPKKKSLGRKTGGNTKIVSCCKSKTGKTVVCVRKSDKKKFNVKTRRFSREKCTKGPVKGFTMRSSCAPWKDC